ncbi:MAG: phospholipase [Methylocapsa sp.]|nr:phospholipase [Methylocapsa sp.]
MASPATGAAGRIMFSSGGSLRSAILIQPSRLKQGRRPAIIVLRAARKQASRFQRAFGPEDFARSSGAVLVYPEPLSAHWADAFGPEPNRDMHFVRELITKLVSHGIANPNKIFLAGIGGGGVLALRLACEGKQKFAGVAVLAASLPQSLESTCTAPNPVPLLMIQGAGEPPVAPLPSGDYLAHGAPALLPVEETLALFGRAAGCEAGATTTPVPAKEMHGARAYIDKLNQCVVPIEVIRVESGGHALPGAKPEAEMGGGAVGSAKLVSDFFRGLGG